MKRAALAVLATVLVVTVGLGVARAAAPTPLDPDNPWVRLLAAGEGFQAQAIHDDPYGANARRIWGDDRYETAVAISQVWSPADETIVFLASGQNFPDALAGSASTLLAGPILLTLRDSLPASTAAEISRLQPCFVIALGGPAAISDAVINQARGLTNRTCEP